MKKPGWDFFAILLFIYFFTLHADQLNVVLGGYTLRLNNLVAGLLFAFVLIRLRRHIFSIPKGLVVPLILIALSMIASLCVSPYKARCSFYLGWYGFTVCCYVWLPYWIVKETGTDTVFTLYKASFICVGLYAALQLILSCFKIHDPFATQSITEHLVRPNAFCFEPSFYALYMTPFVFLYNALFIISGEKKGWRIGAVNVLYLLSTSAAVFFAYGAFFLILCVIPGIDKKRVLRIFLAFLGCLLGLTLLVPFMSHHFFLKFYYQGFLTHHSFFERWVGIQNGWKIFLQHPIFGVGLGGYPCYLMDAFLQGDGMFSYLEGRAWILRGVSVKCFEASNVFTELLASLGVLGLCAYGTLLYALFGQMRQIPPSERQKAYCWLISILVTVFVLQFNQGLFRTYIWVHLTLAYAYIEKASSNMLVGYEIALVHSTA